MRFKHTKFTTPLEHAISEQWRPNCVPKTTLEVSTKLTVDVLLDRKAFHLPLTSSHFTQALHEQRLVHRRDQNRKHELGLLP